MRNIFLKRHKIKIVFFGLLGITLFSLSPAEAVYKGKLTCELFEKMNSSDGVLQAMCLEVHKLCAAKNNLKHISPKNPLIDEISTELERNLNFNFGICEAGFMTYAPDVYKDHLAR